MALEESFYAVKPTKPVFVDQNMIEHTELLNKQFHVIQTS